jgi:hypothetical protein
MFRRALIGGVLAALILTALVVHARRSGPRQAPAPQGVASSKTSAQLAAANYRTLTPGQSRRLIRFATAFRSCMASRGMELTVPQTSPTKIVLQVQTDAVPLTIRSSTFACGERLGGPPPRSSLQTPRGQSGLIVLYVPKQCLLDPTVTSG